jgi:hypothetical protein
MISVIMGRFQSHMGPMIQTSADLTDSRLTGHPQTCQDWLWVIS